MENKKELYNSIMESVSNQVKKVLNEGAGAGYDVAFEGLSLTNVQIIGTDIRNNEDVYKFTADIKPCILRKWSAIGYYCGVDSDGVYNEAGHQILDYGSDDKRVTGGNVTGYIYIDDVEYYNADHEDTEEAGLEYINDHCDDFNIKVSYGAGWVHANLPNPIVFENVETDYTPTWGGSEPVYFERMEIEAEDVVLNINWYFEHWTELDNEEDPEFEEVDESVKGKGKHINESFTLNDDLRQLLRDFKLGVDMGRFQEVSLVDDETVEPSLQRIIDTYDPYVEEVIGYLTCPDSPYVEQNIKNLAQDNEWENGTEANMVVDFLYDLYDWCLSHGLGKGINESEENLSQSEKMDLWHEGKRDQNIKACSADKLRKNLAICKAKGYDGEAAAIEAEIKSRGLKESVINEGEIANDLEAKYGKEFADLVAGVLAQERDIDPETDGDIMFDALVPGSGNADNLGGEILRAAERIAYRYYNDGDRAGEGYGRETVNPAVRFLEARVERQDGCNLYDLVDEIYDFVNRGYCNLVDDDYERLTLNILRETILYIILKQAWNIPNKEDMLDFRDKDEDVDRYDEDDWEENDW